MEDMFIDLQNILKKYTEHKFEFDSGDDVVRLENPMSEAFNILLVVTNHRDAMLLQGFEDQGEEQKGGEEINELMMDMYHELKDLIGDKAELLYDNGDIWIYNAQIQAEVDAKIGTRNMTDILRYPCPFPHGRSITFANFIYTNKEDESDSFISVACENITSRQIAILRTQLDEFKKLSNIIGGHVTLNILFK